MQKKIIFLFRYCLLSGIHNVADHSVYDGGNIRDRTGFLFDIAHDFTKMLHVFHLLF